MVKKYLSRIILFPLCLSTGFVAAQFPSQFDSRGVGGGGALFSPSINPTDESEYYVSSDMSQVFHTSNYGSSYDVMDFRTLQGGNNSKIIFTNSQNLRYTISYANNQVLPVKTTDGGVNWNALAGNPDGTEETFSINADYNNPNRVIVSYYGSIYFSSDGGNSFSNIHNAINTGAGVVVGGVFFDGQKIFIGTNDGLLVSSDGGSTFNTDSATGIQPGQQIFSFAGAKQGNATRFFILTGDANNIYVGTMGWDYWGFIRGVYSMDYGSNSWVNRLPGIVTAQDYLMYVSMASNDTGTAYLAGATYLGEPNVMRWRSSTNQWQHIFQTNANQNIYTGWCGSGGDHGWSFPECIFGIDAARFNSSKIIITDYSCVHKTDDGGVTWKQAYLQTSDQHMAGALTPEYQPYHSSGIENTTCWQVFWRDPNHMLGAFSDITALRSDDAGITWSFDYTGISANTVYRFVRNISNTTLYAATSSIHDMYQSTRLQDAILDAANAAGKVMYSTDLGSSWQTLHDFGHPVYWIATDPNNMNRMYASVVNHSANAGGVWVSNDINLGASSTWTRITPPGRTEGHPGNIQVLNNGTLLCTFNGRRNAAGAFTQSSGVFIYNPGLQQWSDKSDARQFYWTHDVVVDPNDLSQNTWYAGVYNGWGGPPNGLGGLYKTTNGGNSWTRLNTMEGVTSLTFNPLNPDQVFIATEADGLLSCNDINSATPTFQSVPGYAFRQPQRIFFNPYNQTEVWVSSFGNGMRIGDMTSTGVFSTNEKNNELIVFPNPASSFITVNVPISAFGHQLQVFDFTGREIFSEMVNSMSVNLNTEYWQRGIYFVRVENYTASISRY